MFNQCEIALKAAKQYRRYVNNRIEQLALSSLAISKTQASAQSLIGALESISLQYDEIQCDEHSDSHAIEQMVIVGKAMLSLLQAEVMDQNTEQAHMTDWETVPC